jgi:hypothetical protein
MIPFVPFGSQLGGLITKPQAVMRGLETEIPGNSIGE